MEKKPSQRIHELAKQICGERRKHQPTLKDLEAATPQAIMRYLDEQAAKSETPEPPPVEPKA